jgi:GH43 family beta-xylosidase
VFEKRMLGSIFGLKREDVVEVWRRVHNKDLHNLYTSPSIIIMKGQDM